MPNPEKTTPPPEVKRVLPAADDVEALTGDFDKLDVEIDRPGVLPVVRRRTSTSEMGSLTRRRREPKHRPSASCRRCYRTYTEHAVIAGGTVLT